MKSKTWILTIMAFLIAAIGYATEFPKLNVVSLEEDKALIAFSANTANILEISLTNSVGDLVFFKRTTRRQAEFKKVFDFSHMDDGKYCISVNYGNRSVGRSLNVNSDKISVGPPLQLFEPYFKLCGNKLNISFLNCPQKQVYVSVFRNGRRVDRIRMGNNLAIQKCLDLSELEKGEYEIVLTEFFNDHSFMVQL